MYLRHMRWLHLWIMLLRYEVRLSMDDAVCSVAETKVGGKRSESTVGTARTERSEGVLK